MKGLPTFRIVIPSVVRNLLAVIPDPIGDPGVFLFSFVKRKTLDSSPTSLIGDPVLSVGNDGRKGAGMETFVAARFILDGTGAVPYSTMRLYSPTRTSMPRSLHTENVY